MEFEVTENTIVSYKTPKEKKAVLPLECSIILPDYYPDVMKVLRYEARTSVMPVVSEKSGEIVSGNVSIEVNYVSAEGEFCLCTQEQPFSHIFEHEDGLFAAEADISTDNILCRAVNKRRVDMHGSIELSLKTLSGEEKSYVSSVSNAGAVTKTETAEFTEIIGEYYKPFTLDERAETGDDKPPFGRLVDSVGCAVMTECGIIQDKIVTKGEAKIKLLWSGKENEDEKEEYFISEYSFPVSRMIDAVGVTPADVCDARYFAEVPEITPTEDGMTLNIKMKIGAFARAYRRKNADYVLDVFSKDHESETKTDRIKIIKAAVPVSEKMSIEEKFELGGEGESILDFWLEKPENITVSQGELTFGIRLCMFIKNEDGEISYFEKTVEQKKGKEIFTENAFCNVSVLPAEVKYSVEEGAAKLSAELMIEGTVYLFEEKTVLKDCSVSDETEQEENSAAVIFYYASEGENIWDIAKKYKTDIAEIMAENGIDGECLAEKKMLVISK